MYGTVGARVVRGVWYKNMMKKKSPYVIIIFHPHYFRGVSAYQHGVSLEQLRESEIRVIKIYKAHDEDAEAFRYAIFSVLGSMSDEEDVESKFGALLEKFLISRGSSARLLNEALKLFPKKSTFEKVPDKTDENIREILDCMNQRSALPQKEKQKQEQKEFSKRELEFLDEIFQELKTWP